MNLDLFSPRVKAEIRDVESYIEQTIQTSHYRISQNYVNILKAGGKRIRPAFVFLSGEVFGIKKEELLRLASAIEMIHMSTLIHDDIIDNAGERRGKPTISALHGDPWALYAGNYLFAESLAMIDPLKNPEIARVMAKAATGIVAGELLQYRALFNTRQTVRDYLKRIRGKTALLLALSCKVGAMASNAGEAEVRNMHAFGYNLGMAFQIIDDVLDISETADTRKTRGEDMLNGHINLPMIFALQERDRHTKTIREIVGNRFTERERDVELVIRILKEKGTIEKAKSVAFRYNERAKKCLETLPDNMIKSELLGITDSLVERNF